KSYQHYLRPIRWAVSSFFDSRLRQRPRIADDPFSVRQNNLRYFSGEDRPDLCAHDRPLLLVEEAVGLQRPEKGRNLGRVRFSSGNAKARLNIAIRGMALVAERAVPEMNGL